MSNVLVVNTIEPVQDYHKRVMKPLVRDYMTPTLMRTGHAKCSYPFCERWYRCYEGWAAHTVARTEFTCSQPCAHALVDWRKEGSEVAS